MSKEDFDEVPRRAVDDGLSATGESVEQWAHFHARSPSAERIIVADSCFLQRSRIKTPTELAE